MCAALGCRWYITRKTREQYLLMRTVCNNAARSIQRFFRFCRFLKFTRLKVAAGKIIRFFKAVVSRRQMQVTVVLARLARVMRVQQEAVRGLSGCSVVLLL